MARLISPTSSRNSVPLLACSNLPSLRSVAPVKEPFSWPKSSLSSKLSAKAAQFIVQNGRLWRSLLKWMAWATSSLPTPLSPRISTVALVGANRAMVGAKLLHFRALADDVAIPLHLLPKRLIVGADTVQAAGERLFFFQISQGHRHLIGDGDGEFQVLGLKGVLGIDAVQMHQSVDQRAQLNRGADHAVGPHFAQGIAIRDPCVVAHVASEDRFPR